MGEVLQEVRRERRHRNVESLTARQREILQLLAEGRSAKEIAGTLAISARTVEFHKYQMMEAQGSPQQRRTHPFCHQAWDCDDLAQRGDLVIFHADTS